MQIFDDSGKFFSVKVAQFGALDGEFAALIKSYAVWPNYVPRPLALGESGGFQMMVCDGLKHTIFARPTLETSGKILIPCIIDYIEGSAQHFRLAGLVRSHSQDLEQMIRNLDDPELQAALDRRLSKVEKLGLDRLPQVSQHGDFACNNIGITRNSIAIFDWEDFGLAVLPGFDISVLISSCLKFQASDIQHLFRCGEPAVLNEVISAFCENYDIELSFFEAMLPLNLAMFLYFKEVRNYGETVRRSIRPSILQLCCERP